jgi:hypothetical protein
LIIFCFSPHISQVEQHISEHVQRFSQMHRVYQGGTGLVFSFKAVKIVTADLEGRDPPGCVLDPDAAQGSAFAQEKGSDIDIRGLVCGDRSSPPWCRQD